MRLKRACEAIDQGCCLELYYPRHSLVVEPHAVGLDEKKRPLLLAWERCDSTDGHRGAWLFLRLDEAKEVLVSGYFSSAPRKGYTRDDPRFAQIVRQI